VSELALSDELEQLRQSAARFAADELAPAARRAESEGWPASVHTVLESFALRGLDLPESLGGAEGGCLAKSVLLETLASGDAGGLPAADASGPCAGALLACPDKDLAASIASVCLAGEAQATLVAIDAEAPASARVEWAPARPPLRWAWLSEGDVLRLVAPSASPEPIRALAFQASGGVSVALAAAARLGEWKLAPGAGVALRGRARLWSAAVAVGVAQAAFDATVAYTTDRIVFGKPVAHHQGNAFDLAVTVTHLHGARLLLRFAAASFDRGEPEAGYWATQAWIGCMDAAASVTDLGIQLLGGHGFLVDHIAEKRFREVRMLALACGARDAAEADLAARALDAPHPIFGAPGTALVETAR
jgi:alkylation response protein AidB-like acyl-CoA dehydrogenase